MNKNKKYFAGFSLVGFLLFFLTIWFTSSIAIIVYYLAKQAASNTLIVALCVTLTIAGGAILCALLDIYRRRKMIDIPVKKILDATAKIASGDFTIKLAPLHDYYKYDEYDLIFNNINTMTSELSKNEMLKNDFVSNVSHEIKTPLAVIQNYANALQSDKLSKSKQAEYLNGLVTQTKRLSDLITNILKLNKLENQQTSPEMENIDLSELLRVCTLSFETLYDKKNLELDINIDEITIYSSKSLLELVFNNLISNAIKFTGEGGKISISLKETSTNAIVTIKDTGCGISNEVGQHIFEKFYQGDTSRSSEGNGLGLSLVKRVIDIIGGEILVHSRVGQGSTFIIKLKR